MRKDEVLVEMDCVDGDSEPEHDIRHQFQKETKMPAGNIIRVSLLKSGWVSVLYSDSLKLLQGDSSPSHCQFFASYSFLEAISNSRTQQSVCCFERSEEFPLSLMTNDFCTTA